MITNIKGGIAQDERGGIRFVNDFDMTPIKRFYIIKNIDTSLIRGWRGHRIEQRWFYVLEGSFSVDIVKIDNWDNPSSDLPVENFVLSARDLEILYISEGYATAIRALEERSELLVHSDYPLSHAPEDNYTYPIDYFVNMKR
ncbi:WxcM-like domain-containing protein [Sphingobacterium sp. UDSM-2020]|jgi:dTDP-4-dehydrorhamnose 3,5-epimerase-like enzyme|uniref:WxcM-like domain-containing protein n=1 Tax=Sphingobacterium sp. UDSM-2020 TaxID=2795738 RepID=UPI0019366054|nr:WxcM-like domain-containing protein [Sphingobacterium sp. UDSM-2020]QQD15374.1 WxcM-like domain-containing protein [Sphingobacterium sp. UDSM-2020]